MTNQAKSDTTPSGEFEAVQGLDPETIREKRAFEEEVSRKVASDYQHIIWAYGIIWVLFAAYGLLLWRKNARLESDLQALTRRLESI